MDKFQNKFRIPSARLQNWDYRWAGAYFITICSQNKWCYFGKITEQQMTLSNIGIIADVIWHEIPHHAKNIELGEFVIMPNHVHGILIITHCDNDNQFGDFRGIGDALETGHALSLQPQNIPETLGQKRFQNIGKNSMSSIIGSYKSAVSKHARRLGFEFKWQTRFHDHLIRSDKSYQKISDYIYNNPSNWLKDKFYNPNQ